MSSGVIDLTSDEEPASKVEQEKLDRALAISLSTEQPVQSSSQQQEQLDRALPISLSNERPVQSSSQQREQDHLLAMALAEEESQPRGEKRKYEVEEQTQPIMRMCFYLYGTQISITDMLSGNWSEALICNFIVDQNLVTNASNRFGWCASTWLHQSCEPAIPVVLNAHMAVGRVYTEDKYGSHHSKFILAFHPTGLRVCILTGNFIHVDHELKDNAAVILDFPFLTASSSGNNDNDSNESNNDFGPYLKAYLQETNKGVRYSLSLFSFLCAYV